MRWLGKITSADLLTLINGLLGMMAITYILDGEHVLATILILIAVIVDGMDGMAARRFRKKHDFGRFLDSISDAVSFCLAPGILLYSNYYDRALGSAWSSMPNAAAVLASVMFVGFGLLRLARFAGKDYLSSGFRGLPTPAAAMLVIIPCLLWGKEDFSPFSQAYELYPVTAWAIGLSLVMVSDVPYPKVRGRPALVAGTVLAVIILVMGLYVIETELDMPYVNALYVLWVLLLCYLLAGPVYEVTRPGYIKPEKRRKRPKLK